ANEIADFLRVVRLTPLLRQLDYLGPLAPGHLADAIAEESVREERELAARFGEIRHRGFHPRAARSGNRQAELVLRGVGVRHQGADLLRNLKKERVQMADDV